MELDRPSDRRHDQHSAAESQRRKLDNIKKSKRGVGTLVRQMGSDGAQVVRPCCIIDPRWQVVDDESISEPNRASPRTVSRR